MHSYAIAALMTQIPGWKRTNHIRKLPIYGRQRLYIKSADEENGDGKNDEKKDEKTQNTREQENKEK